MSFAPRLDTAFLMRRLTMGTSFSVSDATTTMTRASSMSLMRIVSEAGAGMAVRPCILTFAPFSGPSSRRLNKNASSLVRSCGSEMPSFAPLPLMPSASAIRAPFQVERSPLTSGVRSRLGSLTSA